ncbi:MAG: Uma2 family endonuclease [Snowella sp.]|nr:Uma2 family endonuclease [Snowella sp.]
MTTGTNEQIQWTSADLALLPDSPNHYEIIDGRLEVTRASHWKHQTTLGRIHTFLDNWSMQTGLGQSIITPGVIFTDTDNVIPDLIWMSRERLAIAVDESGHLILAPELIVEVLSDGTDNIRRDRETKLKLYSNRGVQEYWIADWRSPLLEVYRREQGKLVLMQTLLMNDELSSSLLPGFSCLISSIFA